MNILEYQKGLKLEKIKPFNLIYSEEDYLLSVFVEKLSELAPLRVLVGLRAGPSGLSQSSGRKRSLHQKPKGADISKGGGTALKEAKGPKADQGA
jgi:DNA polymerase-3 subunit delta